MLPATAISFVGLGHAVRCNDLLFVDEKKGFKRDHKFTFQASIVLSYRSPTAGANFKVAVVNAACSPQKCSSPTWIPQWWQNEPANIADGLLVSLNESGI